MTFNPRLSEDRVGNFKMETNVLAGFRHAVKNGQNRLSNEYLVELIDGLVEYVEALEARLDKLEKPAKRTTTAKTDAEQS